MEKPPHNVCQCSPSRVYHKVICEEETFWNAFIGYQVLQLLTSRRGITYIELNAVMCRLENGLYANWRRVVLISRKPHKRL